MEAAEGLSPGREVTVGSRVRGIAVVSVCNRRGSLAGAGYTQLVSVGELSVASE